MSQVITFYSYKGGVGRTMALANVAVLLSQWGYKTLMVDWDLEAPGLENFFKDYIDIKKVIKKKGLIDILSSEPAAPSLWKDLITPISIPGSNEPLHLLTVGKRGKDYYDKIRNFDINVFYEKKDGGNFIESLRNQWKENYDFILVDSRTGITDIGGICTIQLPDVLALIFTATDMGFNGILDVAERAVKAQQALPFDRLKLISLPIPARFDTLTEFKISRQWLEKFAKKLLPIYYDWLPTSVAPLEFLELTKIPYVSYFSFGEKLPVIEQGVNDPAGLGYAYETVSALLANNFDGVEHLRENRDQYVNMALKGKGREVSKQKEHNGSVNVFISYAHEDQKFKNQLVKQFSQLENGGIVNFHSDTSINTGADWRRQVDTDLKNADIFLLLVSSAFLTSEYITSFELIFIFKLAREHRKSIVPIILKPCNWKKFPLFNQNVISPINEKPVTMSNDTDKALETIVSEIETIISHVKEEKSRVNATASMEQHPKP